MPPAAGAHMVHGAAPASPRQMKNETLLVRVTLSRASARAASKRGGCEDIRCRSARLWRPRCMSTACFCISGGPADANRCTQWQQPGVQEAVQLLECSMCPCKMLRPGSAPGRLHAQLFAVVHAHVHTRDEPKRDGCHRHADGTVELGTCMQPSAHLELQHVLAGIPLRRRDDHVCQPQLVLPQRGPAASHPCA